MPIENSEHEASHSRRERLESWERGVGLLIRLQREASGLSQAALAKRLEDMGFSMKQTTIAKIEGGNRPLRLSEFAGFAEAFGIPWQTLMRSAENYLLSNESPSARLQERIDSAETLAAEFLADAHQNIEHYARLHAEAQAAAQLIGHLSVDDPDELARQINVILAGQDDATPEA